ncbi:helix-turn-helix domain-containing protein [Desulfovibrio intestinalis]|uniref:Transcriptional regulator with XRE-family HTH domain n=1 Tax=Desulfovibrio intestinalis TaxID=58621 RepID=A0A7W8FFW2_9BACT|nr:helix-turn-helix transcriptional regulator [Desulfovibrio intestinalis]MBB5144393.1 transcriptional regulator with XRE-family HTH domain [Desulfovibrio intestinalis]
MRKRPPSKFGAALIQEYKKRGFTQYSLAKKMERSTRYLNNLEHDRSEPRFTTILLLADAIGMEPGELVNAAAVLSWAALAEEESALEKPKDEDAPKKKGESKKSKKK